MGTKEQKTDDQESVASLVPRSRLYKALRLFFLILALGSLVYVLAPLPALWEVSPLWLVLGFIIGIFVVGIALYFFLAPSMGASESAAFDIETNAVAVMGTAVLLTIALFWLLQSVPAGALPFAAVIIVLYAFYVYRLIKTNIGMEQENDVLRRQYGDLIKIDREKTDFINVTSHQIRTPLTEINWGLGTLIGDKTLEPSSREILQRSLDGIKRLIGTIDEMFRARILEDQSETLLKKEPTNISALVGDVLEVAQKIAMEKQTSINFSPSEKDIIADVDAGKLKIALMNVVENAIRYSPKKSVAVSVSTESGSVVIRVADTGIGIATEDYSRVFTRFYRGKNALLVQPDGSGIGLYNTRYIIQRHGGEITFVSTVGQGTVFMIRLPLARA